MRELYFVTCWGHFRNANRYFSCGQGEMFPSMSHIAARRWEKASRMRVISLEFWQFGLARGSSFLLA